MNDPDVSGLAYILMPCRSAREGTVLFLHGLGSCGKDWVLQIPAFENRYDILAVDLPGHGGSRFLLGQFRIEDVASLTAHLLERLGTGPVHLVGMSLGGTVALALALEHPQLVQSLVLVNTFARLKISPAGRKRISRRLMYLLRNDMDGLGKTVAGGVFPHPEQRELRSAAAHRLAANNRRVYMSVLMALRRFDVRSKLAEILLPTLVISGEEDSTVSKAAKLELSEGIPNAKWVSIPGSSHATPLDSPDIFNRIVLDFIQTSREEGAPLD